MAIGDAAPPRKHQEGESQGRTRQTQNYRLSRGGGVRQAVGAAKTRLSWFLPASFAAITCQISRFRRLDLREIYLHPPSLCSPRIKY